jgi:hypothetical protein
MSEVVEVFATHLGHNVKLGWKPASPEVKAKTLKFSTYHLAELPVAPVGPLGYTAKSSGLSKVFMNDQLGCCVISAYYHIKCTATSLTGTEFVATDQQIVNDYGSIGGYNGTSRSDQGCDIPTALNWWKAHPDQGGTQILGYLAVDATNLTLCRQLIYLFGNLFGGVGLPAAWVGNDMPQANGFVWPVAGRAVAANGHCIPFLDYDTNPSVPGLETDTWALTGTVVNAAVAEYFADSNGGELYVILTPDWVNKAKQIAPNAIAWDQLIQDFDSQGGTVPIPVSPPAPPTPTPPAPPTPGGDLDITWDLTALTVTVPTGVVAISSPLPVGFFIPAFNLVILPTGWTVAGGTTTHNKFDITALITFLTTYGPTALALIESLITAFQAKVKQEFPPGVHEIHPPGP